MKISSALNLCILFALSPLAAFCQKDLGSAETNKICQQHKSVEFPAKDRPTAAEKAATAKAEEDAAEVGQHIITSPIVGTFYRSANPESEAFVNVGDRVSKGQVLCIIEAMKLMNEIESDVDGVVTRIYPQNGQPIEYGEKLFAVKLSS